MTKPRQFGLLITIITTYLFALMERVQSGHYF